MGKRKRAPARRPAKRGRRPTPPTEGRRTSRSPYAAAEAALDALVRGTGGSKVLLRDALERAAKQLGVPCPSDAMLRTLTEKVTVGPTVYGRPSERLAREWTSIAETAHELVRGVEFWKSWGYEKCMCIDPDCELRKSA